MSDAIEAAAKVIDPLAFQPAGSCNPRGYEAHSQEALSRAIAARRSHAIRVAERVVAAYRDSEIEALRGQVAEARELLAHTVMGGLPNDWPLKDVAEARLHDMIDLRNQVRDTCDRAEKAEALIKKQEVEIVLLQMQIDCFYLGTSETRLLNMTKERDALRSALEAILETNKQGIIAANRHFETESKLADCQAVMRHKGHDADCPAAPCYQCQEGRPHTCNYKPGPCSDACGHDRITGETASDTCEWYDDGGDMWVSGCGVVYTFNDGGPVENDHAFCIKCGKRVSVLGDETTGEKA